MANFKENVKQAEYAGADCARNGPNTVNCHFQHFATPQQSAAWQKGKAEEERKMNGWKP